MSEFLRWKSKESSLHWRYPVILIILEQFFCDGLTFIRTIKSILNPNYDNPIQSSVRDLLQSHKKTKQVGITGELMEIKKQIKQPKLHENPCKIWTVQSPQRITYHKSRERQWKVNRENSWRSPPEQQKIIAVCNSLKKIKIPGSLSRKEQFLIGRIKIAHMHEICRGRNNNVKRSWC